MNPNALPQTTVALGVCVQCGLKMARIEVCMQKFMYGADKDAVELAVEVPVWVCAACGLEYTDDSAEDARHEAVCRHLGILTPTEIHEIRETHQRSQAEFASITGFGLASIKRWETGATFQNVAADRFLRLIRNPVMWGELQRIAAAPRAPIERQFRTPISKELLAGKQSFRLRVPHD